VDKNYIAGTNCELRSYIYGSAGYAAASSI